MVASVSEHYFRVHFTIHTNVTSLLCTPEIDSVVYYISV